MRFGGLRLRYPACTEQYLQRRLPALFLDRETVIEVYGRDPKVEGYDLCLAEITRQMMRVFS